jgi:hypothetical protein
MNACRPIDTASAGVQCYLCMLHTHAAATINACARQQEQHYPAVVVYGLGTGVLHVLLACWLAVGIIPGDMMSPGIAGFMWGFHGMLQVSQR